MFLFIIIYALLGMQMYGGEFMNYRYNPYRNNYDSFQNAFITVFQLLTLENWGDILILAFRSSVNKFLTSIYLISWIFIGNFVFLNLFLAILIDGFCSELDNNYDDDIIIDEDNKFFSKTEELILKNNPDL